MLRPEAYSEKNQTIGMDAISPTKGSGWVNCQKSLVQPKKISTDVKLSKIVRGPTATLTARNYLG